MSLTGLRTYLKFLSRHKVYTFVSVTGFAMSLTFVLILLLYAQTETSMDSFHENKERIYMITMDGESGSHCNPIGEYVANLLPEIETYTRVLMEQNSIGISETEWISGMVMFADKDFFRIFSFPLTEGNPNYVLAGNRSGVLSQTTARKLFGDENPVGKTVLVEEMEITITGVMEDFPYNTHLMPPDIIVSYQLLNEYWGNDILANWSVCSFSIYFMTVPGAEIHSKKELLLDKFRQDYWLYRNGFNNEIDFLRLDDIYYSTAMLGWLEIKSGSHLKTNIYMGIALLILIIAILNYMNMTMAQSGFRGREAAVRKMMGSGRGRIIMQHLIESFIMVALSLGIALVLAFLFEPFFNSVLNTQLGFGDKLRCGAVLWTLPAIVLLSLIAGIIPAVTVASFHPIEVVKGTVSHKIKTGYSKILIVFQYIICAVLLITALCMRQQTGYLLERDAGYNRENILIMSNTEGNMSEIGGLRQALLQVPGVEAVGFSHGAPVTGGNHWPVRSDGEPVSVQLMAGDSAYVEIFGLELFPSQYTEGCDVEDLVFLNEMALNALRPNPETGRIENWADRVYAGDLGEFHINSLHDVPGPAGFVYLPDSWWPWDIVVKIASDDVVATGERVREAYLEYNGNRYFEWNFVDDIIEEWYVDEKRMTGIMGVFTLLSIVIMVMGVFAMSLYMIKQKEKEIGIRKVHGATVGEVLGMLNRQSLLRVAVALVIAGPVAFYAVSKWLEQFPYRINIGLWPFLLAGLLVTALCLLSVSWQTWRAARANPVESLKSE